jgi:tripartite-type tricarboxylate transporter receptor subunit TctC
MLFQLLPGAAMTNRLLLRHCVVVAFVAAMLGATDVASAQDYPTRVIKIIVPFGPGGQPDVVARVFAQNLAATIGATIIDNRPGANTTIGTKVAAAAEPDGYTLLFGSSTSLAIAPAISQNVGYDPVKSFTAIAGISSSPMHLAVGPSVSAKSVAELLAYARANPGKLNFAAPTGSPPHLAGEIFKRATNIDITPIHYRSMNQAIIDLLAGQMDIVFDSPAPLASLLQEGKLRALVSLGSRRMPELADVPTVMESGLPDLQVVTWNGLVAPAGTPEFIVAKLNAAINDSLKSPAIRATLSKFGSEPLGGTPQEFASFVSSESRKWSEIIRLSGVKVD